MQIFKPTWNPFTSDPEEKFGFLRQPRAIQLNLVTLARALMPLVVATLPDPTDRAAIETAAKQIQTAVTSEFDAELDANLHKLRCRKLGLAHETPIAAAAELWDDLVGVVTPVEQGGRGTPGLLELSTMDWTIFWRGLAMLAQSTRTFDKASSFEESIHTHLFPAAYDEKSFETRKSSWENWLKKWQSYRPAADSNNAEAVQTMIRTSPLCVPREWLLARAYTAAEHGDYSALHEAYRVLSNPFVQDADPVAAARFTRRTPTEVLAAAGIAYFS